jgi:hypothetical protein
MRTDVGDGSQEIVRATFDARDFFDRDMLGASPELARFGLDMQGDLLPAVVEDPYSTPVPADPDTTPDILRADAVVRLVHFDIAVAMDLAGCLMKERESFRRKFEQCLAFARLEVRVSLLARCAVDPRVGKITVP